MQNSKVRFKLYKAKKNWVSAGLVTTAVLAGLTLGTVKNNNVVAHADATPVATQTTDQKAETPKATEEKSDVQKTADQINKVKDEVANVQKANEANKDVQPTTDANKAADQDKQIVNNHKAAKDALKDAQATQTQAGKDVDNATAKANDAKTAVQEAGKNLDQAAYNQKDAVAVQKAAQESYDDNQNAITDADKDMDTNIRPAKEKADKAYTDQLAYQKQLEDGLSRFGQDLKNKQDAQKAAQQKVDDTAASLDKANEDLLNNVKPAQKAAQDAYDAVVNDPLVKYVDAKNTANADKQASDKAASDYAAAQEAYLNEPNEWNDEAQQAAQDAAEKAEAKATASQTALNDLKAAAEHQYQREISGYRHNPTHENAVRVNNAKKVLDTMNNYDAYVAAQNNENDKLSALQNAQQATVNDNSEYNQEAEAAAQRDYDAATDATTAAKANVQNLLDKANSRASLKAALDKANQDVEDQKATIKKLGTDLDNFNQDLRQKNEDVQAAQKKVDDTRNAITDADNDMDKNIRPAKEKADKAYNDQLAYQQMLEDHLNKVTGPQLQEANKELDEANQAVKDASDKLTAANNDKIAADNNLTAAKQNKADADDLVAAAQSAMDTADDLVDEKVPSYIKGNTADDQKDNGSQDTTDPEGKDVNTNTETSDTTPAAKTAATTTMTRAAYRAQQNNAKANSNKLPQTGSEDSAAVMALGAVSAMLGLGLAAKKREA